MNKNLQILTLFLILGLTTLTYAQTGQSNFINYQGVASNSTGEVMADETIIVGIMLRYATSGAAEYAENHAVTTDANGVFSLKIGNGTATISTYANYQWGRGIATFVTVSINGTEIGTTELLAVPYALSSGDNQWMVEGDDIENLNAGTVKVSSNLDVGGNIKLQLGPAANEISIDGSLAGNNDKAIPTEKAVKTYVDANGGSSLWTENGSDIHFNTGNIGIGTNSPGYMPGAARYLSISPGVDRLADGDFGALEIRGYQQTLEKPIGRLDFISAGTVGGSYGIARIQSRITDGALFRGDLSFHTMDGTSLVTATLQERMTIKNDGKVGIGWHQPSSLLEVAHQDGPPTSADRTNAFSIRNLGNVTDLNDDRTWQFYTHPTGYLELFSDGSHKGSFNPSSGAYNVVSDRKLKKEIVGLDNGMLNKVLQLRPVSYLFKDQKDTKRNLGLISQEVQEIFPTLTHYLEDQDILELSYTELIPILIKALQEQQEIINVQKTKIEGLSADVTAIKIMLKNSVVKREVAEK